MLSNISLKEAMSQISSKFTEAAIKSPQLDARLLLQYVLNLSHEEFILSQDRELSENELGLLDSLVKRRLSYEPVAKIIGYKEFWSLNFKTSKDTLDPRPDSETLIECVLSAVNGSALRILDLGTGTGCLLLTLLSELKDANGVGVDISSDALTIARQNADNLEFSSRVSFIKSNWFDGVKGKFDVIISNPPYIPAKDIESLEPEVRKYDPMSALDGGDDGLDEYRKIIAVAGGYLNPQGAIFLEIGQGQEVDISAMLQNSGFKNIQTAKDLAGITRCVFAFN